MEVIVEDFFIRQLMTCPIDFQKKFRQIYQQLKVVDNPSEVKGIRAFGKNKKDFKIFIDNSRIALKISRGRAVIGMFLYNEYFEGDD